MSFMGSGSFGFDETMGGPMDIMGSGPSMSSFSSPFRSSGNDASTIVPSIFNMKAMTLAEAPRMPATPKAMLGKVPLLGSLYTGYNTASNNPANLNGPGRFLHGLGTGTGSFLTPTPVGMADALTGNHFGNAQEDLIGAALKPMFGKPTIGHE